MTKEEIINAIANDKLMPFIQPEQLAGIVDFVIENYKPELPANLDEAAERMASDIAPDYPDISWDTCYEKIKEGIKAGAEWMAGREKLPKIHGWLSKDPGDYYVHFSIDKPVFDGTYWQSNDCMLTIPEEVVPWVTPDKLAVVELLIRKK